MAYTLTVQNDKGDTLNLSESQDIRIFKIDGLTPAAAEISTIDAVGYDGGVFSNARTGYRNITLQLVPINDIETSRQLLYNYFVPKKQVRLFFKNANRDVFIDGYVESMDGDLFSEMQTADISIICPNPYFIMNEDHEHHATNIVDNQHRLTLNGGDVESGLIFGVTLYAPEGRNTPIIIENETYGETIRINNTEGTYRGYYEINTSPGNKRAVYSIIKGGTETNIIWDIEIPLRAGGMSRKWVTLHPGENLFKIYIPGRSESEGTGLSVIVTADRYYVGV